MADDQPQPVELPTDPAEALIAAVRLVAPAASATDRLIISKEQLHGSCQRIVDALVARATVSIEALRDYEVQHIGDLRYGVLDLLHVPVDLIRRHLLPEVFIYGRTARTQRGAELKNRAHLHGHLQPIE